MPNVPLHFEIANAIVDGLGEVGASVRRGVSESWVDVPGHDAIRVLNDDVILPTSLEAIAPGVRLDVQAIIASR